LLFVVLALSPGLFFSSSALSDLSLSLLVSLVMVVTGRALGPLRVVASARYRSCLSTCPCVTFV